MIIILTYLLKVLVENVDKSSGESGETRPHLYDNTRSLLTRLQQHHKNCNNQSVSREDGQLWKSDQEPNQLRKD